MSKKSTTSNTVNAHKKQKTYMYLCAICTPSNNVDRVYVQELLHSYYRVKVVTIFVCNEECTSHWFPWVSTSRVPEPCPMTVAHDIFAR